MKKILAFTMAVLLVLSLLGGVSISAEEYSPKFDESLIRAIENATEDELIPVLMFTKAEFINYMNFPEYIKDKGYDEKTISKEQEEALRKEFDEVYLKEIDRQIQSQYTQIFEEVFGGATPDETYFGRAVECIGLTTTKDKILLLGEYDMITSIGYTGADPDKTAEEKAFLMKYASDHGYDPQKFCANSYLEIYGEASGYTLFFISPGAENCLMYEEWIEDVFLVRGFNRGEPNPSGVETLDKDGNYSTLSAEYKAGRLDIHEAHKVLPFAYLLGDIDFDKEITVKDATKLQKILAKTVTGDNSIYFLAEYKLDDVNADKDVNIKDATYIQKLVAGLL